MKATTLGRSDISVSPICLGTMTFGNQTPQEDAHRQIDMALAAGVSFLDTAEMYPVNPIRAETVGNSERVIGEWLAKTGRRREVQIATKISGPNNGYVRGGAGYDGTAIIAGVEASLRRLQTDVIDLYQLHWPARGSYMFRQNWSFDPSGQDPAATMAHMEDVLRAMDRVVRDGKVRGFGLSNESAWGTARWIDTAERMGAPRVATVQNEYSLLCRLYDTDMAELAVNEGVTLLAFSPLAAGLLTGKYQNGQIPEASRMAVDLAHGGTGKLGGRKTGRVFDAVAAYLDLAQSHGLDPIHMAIAWQFGRPFPVIPIIGATDAGQLAHLLAGRDLRLPNEVVSAIDDLHRQWPLPY